MLRKKDDLVTEFNHAVMRKGVSYSSGPNLKTVLFLAQFGEIQNQAFIRVIDKTLEEALKFCTSIKLID